MPTVTYTTTPVEDAAIAWALTKEGAPRTAQALRGREIAALLARWSETRLAEQRTTLSGLIGVADAVTLDKITSVLEQA